MRVLFIDDEWVGVTGVKVVTPGEFEQAPFRPRTLTEFYLRALLQRRHEVRLISSPTVAIDYLRSRPTDLDAIVLDIQMPVEELPWRDQFTTGLYVIRKVLEHQASVVGEKSNMLPRMTVLTHLSDERTYARLRMEHARLYPDNLWISTKGGGEGTVAYAWVLNLESWIETGKVPL